MDEIYNYIAQDSPRAAIAMRDRIFTAFDRLLSFPNSGHATDYPGRREMLVAGTPYLIRYRIVKNELQIIDIKHGAQNQWKP